MGLISFFQRKKYEDDTEKIVNEAVNELNCHKIYEEYVECISKTRISYASCPKIMEKYQLCAVAALERKNDLGSRVFDKKNNKEINPKVFEKL